MSATGIQPRGDNQTPRGITHVKVVKPAMIVSRHCVPGDVILVEKSDGKIMPATDGLTEDFAERLSKLGIVKIHQPQPGDKPISVRPIREAPEVKVESAKLDPRKTSEQAVTGRQKAAI